MCVNAVAVKRLAARVLPLNLSKGELQSPASRAHNNVHLYGLTARTGR